MQHYLEFPYHATKGVNLTPASQPITSSNIKKMPTVKALPFNLSSGSESENSNEDIEELNKIEDDEDYENTNSNDSYYGP